MHRDWFIVGVFSLIAVLTLSGAITALVISTNAPNINKVKCDETNCTVNVQNGECYAKMKQACFQEFRKVKCDVVRQYDVNNITLPCDILSGERIIINCDSKNNGKSFNIFISTMMIIFSGVVLLSSIFIGCAVYHVHGFLDEPAQEKPNPAPNNDFNEVDEKVHKKTHEKNTGTSYTRFDKV